MVQAKRLVKSATTRGASSVISAPGSGLYTSNVAALEASILSKLSKDEAASVTNKEWQKVVQHPNDFQTAARSSRINDMDPASKVRLGRA